MADFNAPKVIIDQAEYEYLKAIEAQEPEPTLETTDGIELYQLLLGQIITALPDSYLRRIDSILKDNGIAGTLSTDLPNTNNRRALSGRYVKYYLQNTNLTEKTAADA